MDAKDCEQYSNRPCCDCRNQYAHQLEDYLKKINELVYECQFGNRGSFSVFNEIHKIVEEEVFNENC